MKYQHATQKPRRKRKTETKNEQGINGWCPLNGLIGKNEQDDKVRVLRFYCTDYYHGFLC